MLNQILDALHIEIPQLLSHTVGFLILLWGIKRFGWKPLMGALDARTERIKNSFDEIDSKNAQAEKLNQEYQAKLRDIENEARKRLTAAVQEGEKIAAQIKDTARGEAKEIMARTKSELEQDVAKARVQLKEDVVNLTIGATEKIIHERLDAQKHRELISRFIEDVDKVK